MNILANRYQDINVGDYVIVKGFNKDRAKRLVELNKVYEVAETADKKDLVFCSYRNSKDSFCCKTSKTKCITIKVNDEQTCSSCLIELSKT